MRISDWSSDVCSSDLPIRHAVEIRHDSFMTPRFVELLRRPGIALVFADTVEWPYFDDLTPGIVYARLHGSEELYASGSEDASLDRWAAQVRPWAAGGESREARRLTAPSTDRARRDGFHHFGNDITERPP